ncbi:MAG: hypothetical protein ACOCVM_04135 [Desulfovibrionaceae bacterium]
MGGASDNRNRGASLVLRKPPSRRRAFSVFDAFLYGVYADSIVIAAALTYALVWPWADANIPLGVVMVCLAFAPMFTVYAMLTSLAPRFGGDYAWQSRALGGFWAYVLVFTPLLFGPWFYMASNVAPGSSMVAAPVLISLGRLWDAPSLVSFAAVFATKTGAWWFYVLYVTFAAVVLVLGMRFYAGLQRVSFFIGALALATWALMLLSTSAGQFPELFNAFMDQNLQWGDGQAYQEILELARREGFEPVPLSETSWRSSFLIGPALAYTFMYIAWTGTLAGEIQGVRRPANSMKVYLGGNLFSMVVCAGFIWLLLTRVGNEFFTSCNFLWTGPAASDLPVTPHYGLFLMALSDNPWVWLWVALGFNAWFWIWPANNMVMSTRVMFAMSGDRLLPSFLGRVSARRKAPFAAIAVCYFGCLVMGWLYYFTDFSRLTLNMPLMTSIAFAASTLVGTLFPYLKNTREIYAASRFARHRVLGLPVITVCGSLGLAYFAAMFYLYLTDDRYGVNHPLSAVFILASISASALIYWGFRRYRSSKGVDMGRVLDRIPSD